MQNNLHAFNGRGIRDETGKESFAAAEQQGQVRSQEWSELPGGDVQDSWEVWEDDRLE